MPRGGQVLGRPRPSPSRLVMRMCCRLVTRHKDQMSTAKTLLILMASRDFQPTAASGFVEDGPHDDNSALNRYGCVPIKLYLRKQGPCPIGHTWPTPTQASALQRKPSSGDKSHQGTNDPRVSQKHAQTARRKPPGGIKAS